MRHDHGVPRRDRDVAGQREGQPDSRRGAVEGGDERLVGPADQADHRAELVADPLPRHGRALLVVRRVEPFHGVAHHPQVAAGREPRPAPREDDRAHLALPRQLLRGRQQLEHQRRAEDVALLRVAEADDRAIAPPLHLDQALARGERLLEHVGVGLGRHVVSPFRACPCPPAAPRARRAPPRSRRPRRSAGGSGSNACEVGHAVAMPPRVAERVGVGLRPLEQELQVVLPGEADAAVDLHAAIGYARAHPSAYALASDAARARRPGSWSIAQAA